MSLLLCRGATLDARDNNGQNAEAWARARHRTVATALFLANVRRAGTPLIRAAIIGDCDMIGLLLSRGAALDASDNDGCNAEDWARAMNQNKAASLLGDVRRAGGWKPFSLDPRKRLLALRVLCEQGRAKTEDALLRRLFPWHPPTIGVMTRAARRARTQGAVLPNKFVFWLILKFWRDF